MEATTGHDWFNQLSSDLLAAEILPWLSYGQLGKVARVSKKFANIVKKIGSFTIDTFRQRWLKKERVQQHVARSRYLTLSGQDTDMFEYLASLNQNYLEQLDVQMLKGSAESLTPLLASIIKNNVHHNLSALKVPGINFEKLVEDKIVCNSVHSLVIRNTNYYKELIKTEDILRVFPSLKRLELSSSENPNIDLFKYLCENVNTPLEHVFMTSYDTQNYEECKSMTADMKSIDFYMGLPDNKFELLKNMSQLRQLSVDLGYRSGYKLPTMKYLESLNINSEDAAAFKLVETAKNLTHLTANLEIIKKAKLPHSLKSLDTRINDREFKADVFTKLPKLEILSMYDMSSSFWTMKKGSLSKTLKQLKIECYISEWNPTMNSFVNLTHFSLSGSNELKKIPSEFFKTCTKLTHFSIENCGITSVSRKIRHCKELEFFRIKRCKLTSIPDGIKELQHLNELDLRDNPFTLESVPLTIPVKTVVFKDREWIQLIQRYLVAVYNATDKKTGVIQTILSFFEKSPAPTVAQMMKMPCLSTRKKLEEGRLGRVVLHAFKVKGVVLDAQDEDSNYLAGSLMRYDRSYDDFDDDSDNQYLQQREYYDKPTIVGIILFNEWNSRHNSRQNSFRLVRVEASDNSVKTYALEVADQDNGNGGWFSRAVWRLNGHIHEFKDLKVTQKETKFIRSVVEPK